ncbi:hypothetical protein KKF91_11680 [Myxococcota bacterium]|nr:hypothetical protein [Myxococcota bacterium]MBU1431189.1 hypothetical protein [Myxococcota bacterium]MBU1897874.1 hypothetical protein [Myxococcota bacterium]
MRALSPLSLLIFAACAAPDEGQAPDAAPAPSAVDLGLTPLDVYGERHDVALIDASARDAAPPPLDRGAPPLDQGAPPLDRGAPPLDRGVISPDQGAPGPDAAPQDATVALDLGLPFNDLNCNEIIDCVGQCGDDDPCRQACYLMGTPEAQRAFIDAINCITRTGCQQDCGLVCAEPLEACIYDEALTCEGIYDCFAGCAEGDQICMDNCYGQARPSAQDAYNNLVACFQVTDCRAQDNCETICALELGICFP